MKTATEYTLNQLATVLSALDGQRRNPNTKRNAITAIGRSAKPLDLTAEEVLAAADGLLDGRIDANAFRKALATDVPANMAEAAGPQDEPAEAYIMTNACPLADGEPEAEPAEDLKIRYGTRPQGGARQGTKQATLIEMMSRPEGATVDQLAAALGWRNHTVRGAIAGAIKKKLDLAVTTERVRGGDGARGAYTIYRIQPTKYRAQA